MADPTMAFFFLEFLIKTSIITLSITKLSSLFSPQREVLTIQFLTQYNFHYSSSTWPTGVSSRLLMEKILVHPIAHM